MSVLLDTNILVRLVQKSHPQHVYAQLAIDRLKRRGQRLVVFPQNLYEFWTVCTRPVSLENGLGLDVVAAKIELDRAKSLFTLLTDEPAIYDEWEKLVILYATKGKPSHDARIVAAMNVHGVSQLLTFNTKDFARYSGITVLDPAQVIA